MARGKTSDITNKFKKMRKCKIIELLKSPEVDLTEDEMDIDAPKNATKKIFVAKHY